MGCNCGGKGKVYIYRYVSSTGQVTTYDTEVKAKAAVIKNGGRYTKVAKA
jgi:hypothetical protein